MTRNPRGQIRSFGHDALDRLTSIGSTESSEGTVWITHDPGKWLAKRESRTQSDGNYSLDWQYDSLGRIAQKSMTGWQADQVADYAYDLLGRTTQIKAYGHGLTVRYEYSGAFLDDVCGFSPFKVATCADSDAIRFVSDVTYDELGRRHSMRMAKGVRTFTFEDNDGDADVSGRELVKDEFVGGTATAASLAYEYPTHDPLGNVLSWGITGPLAGSAGNAGGSYTYDARNRLLSSSQTVNGLTTNEGFGYDALGNLTTHGNVPQRFQHASKPHALTSRGAAGAETLYAYDDSGNLKHAGSNRFFTFDSADRLIKAGSSAGTADILRVHYDSSGERIYEESTTPGVVRGFLGPDLVHERRNGHIYRFDIRAFGERVAYSIHTVTLTAPDPPAAGMSAALPLDLPPGWIAFAALAGLGGSLRYRDIAGAVRERN